MIRRAFISGLLALAAIGISDPAGAARKKARKTGAGRKRSRATSARSGGGGASYYPNCSAVRAAGAAPIREGDPGYSRRLDRDGDGIACE